jgi:hypothetical protein
MTELLLVIGVLAATVVLVLLAMSLVLAGIRLVTAYFVLPVEPPGLARLRHLHELLCLEQQAAAADARRHHAPPPEIVTTLRTIAGRRRGRSGSTWSTRPVGD